MKTRGSLNLSITWGEGERSRAGPGCFTYGNELKPVLIYYEEEGGWALECLDALEEKNLFPLMGMKPQFFDFAATSQVMCQTHHAVMVPN